MPARIKALASSDNWERCVEKMRAYGGNKRGRALRIAVKMTALSIMLLAGGAVAEESYEFLSKWISYGSSEGQFNYSFVQ